MDSFFGYFPLTPTGKSIDVQVFNLFGGCNPVLPNSTLTSSLRKKCVDGTLTTFDVVNEAVTTNPPTFFYGINSKNDAVQINFHNIFAQALGIPQLAYNITGPEYFNDINKNLLTPLSKQRNFAVFVVDGTGHTYINQKYLYSTTNTGCGTSIFDISALASFCVPGVAPNPNIQFALKTNLFALPSKFSKVKTICVDTPGTASCGSLATTLKVLDSPDLDE